ncbi:MAG: pyridoxamine 5'-phosphate oxidase family protein [Planctomycetota bacterium]|jgi:nitroimidazol reductase NimA-like FMN-containing flavoprotein (pyridoxamine 5'-phosphate oxidase superfamily)
MSGLADEPALGRDGRSNPASRDHRGGFGRAEVAALVEDDLYGVLCTQAGGQPYGSLLAFASSEDLRCLVFATPVTTRKYSFLTQCAQMAFLVDDRSRQRDHMTVSAVTAVGKAVELRGDDRDRWAAVLLARHSYLAEFVHAPTCALFRVDVARYFHVTRFQEVHEWRP